MKPLRSLTIISLSLLSLLALAAPSALADARSECAGVDADAATVSAAALRTSVICLANRERVARGMGALKQESRLTAAAQAHSDDMSGQNYFAHDDLTGGGPSDRAKNAGYTTGWVGENIGGGYASPFEVTLGWMESSGHCANILDAKFVDVGIGVASTASSAYGVYWTMVLGGNNSAAPRVTVTCPYAELISTMPTGNTTGATTNKKARLTLVKRRSDGRYRVEGKVTPAAKGTVVKLTVKRGKKTLKFSVKTTKAGRFATTVKAPRGSRAVRVAAKV